MNLEIICGCMPHLAGFFKRKGPDTPLLSPIKSLASRITSGITRRFKSSESTSNFDRVKSQSASDPYLESYILESVKGSGKFMQSGVQPQKTWLGQNTEMKQSQGPSTAREEFND